MHFKLYLFDTDRLFSELVHLTNAFICSGCEIRSQEPKSQTRSSIVCVRNPSTASKGACEQEAENDCRTRN